MHDDTPPRSSGRNVLGSIRFRTTAAATIALLAVLGLTAFGLVTAQRTLLTENLEESLRELADRIETDIETEGTPTALSPPGDDILAQVADSDGSVLATSPGLEGAAPIGLPPRGGTASTRTVDGLAADGESFLVLARTVRTPRGPLYVYVGGGLDDIAESTAALTTSLAVVTPVVALVLAALVWWMVGHTLRPVEAIRAEVAAIGGAELDRRVPVPAAEDEIARLARTMNGMLERIEEMAERQRRFVADASHELRGPLARIRSELEVDAAHPDTADVAATRRSVIEETAGLQRLVEDLLLLARSDAGAAVVRREPVDLDDIVLRHARRLRESGRARVDTSGVSAAQVPGDPDQLARAVRNLTDNAARHATSSVTLTLTEQDGSAVLTVEDDGPGIPPAAHERVFERFTRLDESRNAEEGGSGLGLAITRDIAVQHGGSVCVENSGKAGTCLVLTLPLEPVA